MMTEDEFNTALRAIWWPDDPFPWTPDYGRQHWLTFKVVAHLQPLDIFEIGVRAGYSAWAMLTAAPQAQFLGWDLDQGGYGGMRGIATRARRFLAEHFPDRTQVEVCDSQRQLTLPQRFDLAHIDGDHSYEGTFHDLALCAPFCRYLLVDDYDHIAKVRDATNAWLIDNLPTGLRYHRLSDGGFRGAMLIDLSRVHPYA